MLISSSFYATFQQFYTLFEKQCHWSVKQKVVHTINFLEFWLIRKLFDMLKKKLTLSLANWTALDQQCLKSL